MTTDKGDGALLPAPAKRDILGTAISTTSYADLLEIVGRKPRGDARVVTFCNVHSVMSARREPQLRAALLEADVACPDGMPLVWMLRRRDGLPQPRVYGPDFMEYALVNGVARGWRHYFLGATDATLERLDLAARRIAPGVRVVGRFAPPFRPLSPAEDTEIWARVRDSGADLLWVGLGMPKQELWMHRARTQLPGVTLLGVGAAFDLLSGAVPQAPDWLQDRGLEWAYRLWREPRRLWRRYLFNNPAFAALAAADLLAARTRR